MNKQELNLESENYSSLPLYAEQVKCPICNSPAIFKSEALNWGTWQSCTKCSLEFVNPMHLVHNPVELYEDAYQGKVDKSGMSEYINRIAYRKVILEKLDDPELWFWTPAFTQTLNWLKKQITPRSTVLELGCALGFFLHALKKEGFTAVGLDVAQTVVELNRQSGFKVWHGSLETMPENWVIPDAVVSFFVLHHLEDPLTFLNEIKSRYPNKPLALAVHGHNKYSPYLVVSSPPRTLTRWNKEALNYILKQVGYQADIFEFASTNRYSKSLSMVRNIMRRLLSFPRLYSLLKKGEIIFEAKFASKILKPLQQEGAVLLALAIPVVETNNQLKQTE